jgi:hypothetical protein
LRSVSLGIVARGGAEFISVPPRSGVRGGQS